MRRAYIWRDMGWASIKSNTSKLNSTEVVAGLVGPAVSDTHDESGLSVAEIGILNEFGSDDGHIPERSFMRDILKRRKGEYQKVAAKAIKAILYGKAPADRALVIIGEWAAHKIRNNITRSTPPPNKPVTVALKGHSRTLIETGLMLASVGWEIVSAAGARMGIGGGKNEDDWLGGRD